MQRAGMNMPEDQFLLMLQAEAANLTQAVATKNGDWIIKGFIDIYRRVYTISVDTKVISKVLELLLIPKLAELGERWGYRLELAPEQNFYPDMSFISATTGDKYALDIKSTYRTGTARDGRATVNGMTLGAFTGYFRDRTSTKNTLYPYSAYKAHLVLGVIYSKAESRADEKRVYQLVAAEEMARQQQDQTQQTANPIDIEAISDLARIASVVTNFQFFVQPKYRIAHWRPGSGNTKNIGSVTIVDQLVNGAGPFAGLGEHIYDDYWMYYLTADMARKVDTMRPYTDLATYREYKRLGSQIPQEYVATLEQQDVDSTELPDDGEDAENEGAQEDKP